MFALIIYGEECVCVHFTLQFYGGKARKQVPDPQSPPLFQAIEEECPTSLL